MFNFIEENKKRETIAQITSMLEIEPEESNPDIEVNEDDQGWFFECSMCKNKCKGYLTKD